MPLVAKQTGGGGNLDPVPHGSHHAICYSIVDIGTQYSKKYDKSQHKIVLTWEVPDERMIVMRDGQELDMPRVISGKYTLSLSDLATLRQHLASWRSRDFTQEELDGFDVFTVAGANCLISVVHEQDENKRTYAKVKGVSPLLKSMSKKEPENPIVTYCLGEGPIPATVPEWLVKLIHQSEEWMAMEHAADGRVEDDAREEWDENAIDDIPF